MKTYIVAVSGGVDSVVLLDMMARHEDKNRLIVAHFDHGIRADSAADARFVEALARSYGLLFETKREELGEKTSEAFARERRYKFLRHLALKHNGRIVTAHHHDDLVETIAINLTRGTGWRGLAVLDDLTLLRPLLAKRKPELYRYALQNSLEWCEDETNNSTKYLRNRLRKKTNILSSNTQRRLTRLHSKQKLLRRAIEREIERFSTQRSRYFFIMIPDDVALELLRSKVGARLTRPQLRVVLMAIKTAAPHTSLEAGSGIDVRFTKTDFVVEPTAEMV